MSFKEDGALFSSSLPTIIDWAPRSCCVEWTMAAYDLQLAFGQSRPGVGHVFELDLEGALELRAEG
jgi:hypothetical protein